MRSQVQVLAGPPPIVAGQSAAGTELGALATGLGRAGAARPSPPAPPVAPPGSPTRASGSATTTHRGRAPSRGRQPGGGSSHLALPAPLPTAQPPATGAPHAGLACVVAQGSSAAAARTRPGGRVRHRPPSDQRDLGSVGRVPASWTVDRAVDGPAARWAATGSGGQGRPATSTWSPTPPPEHGRRRTRPDRRGRHRTAGHRTAGHRTADSRRLDTGRVDSRRPSAGPSGRRPQVTGHRTAGQPDPGRRTRMGGHRLLDTGDRRRGLPAGRVDHGDHARPPRYRLDAPLGRRRLGEQPPGPLRSKDAGGTHAATDGSGHRRDVSCRRYAAVQLAPWRTAVLRQLRVERSARW